MPTGICHICGRHGELTYEHIPPAAAFNDERILEADINRLIDEDRLLEEYDSPTGKYNQRGAGAYTLCGFCNSKTGDWYARDYVRFAKQAMPFIGSSDDIKWINFNIRPMNVLKHFLVMFSSANPPAFTQKNPDLVRFLLNPESTDYEFNRKRIFLSLYDLKNSFGSRQSGITASISGSQQRIYSEICFPPFNAILSVDGSVPEYDLFEISFFSQFEFRERRQMTLPLRTLPVNTYFPGDYRKIDQVKDQAKITHSVT